MRKWRALAGSSLKRWRFLRASSKIQPSRVSGRSGWGHRLNQENVLFSYPKSDKMRQGWFVIVCVYASVCFWLAFYTLYIWMCHFFCSAPIMLRDGRQQAGPRQTFVHEAVFVWRVLLQAPAQCFCQRLFRVRQSSAVNAGSLLQVVSVSSRPFPS